MAAEIFLYSAYSFVCLLYLASGFLLLLRPEIIEQLIPKLFPLLAHFRLQRISNALNLIIVGCILLFTAEYLVEKEFIGFFIALVLSVWEVYLSVTFYLKYHTRFDVWSHFLVHIGIVFFVGWLLLSDYEKEIDILRNVWFAILAPDMAGQYFLDIFREHILIVAFFVCLFGGEPAVLFFAFLSAQGKLNPFDVVIIGLMTALIGEIFWFVFSKTHTFNFLDSKFFEIGRGNWLFSRVKKVLDAAPFKMFFLARFISGITIPCIIYLGRKRLRLNTFFLYCLAINFFWAPIVTLIGWSSGKGFVLALETFKNIQIALNIVFGCLIVGYLIYRYISRRIIRTSSELELLD